MGRRAAVGRTELESGDQGGRLVRCSRSSDAGHGELQPAAQAGTRGSVQAEIRGTRGRRRSG